MIRWFAVHTHAKSEEKARQNLERQGFRVYLPRYLKKRCHARRTDWTPTPLFPRYLFVGMDMETARWRVVNSTYGVSHVVANGNSLLDVPDNVLENIRQRENEDGWINLEQTHLYRKGEKVRIKDGPMQDQIGLFDCVDDNERVFILLDLLGRAVKVRMDAENLSSVH